MELLRRRNFNNFKNLFNKENYCSFLFICEIFDNFVNWNNFYWFNNENYGWN